MRQNDSAVSLVSICSSIGSSWELHVIFGNAVISCDKSAKKSQICCCLLTEKFILKRNAEIPPQIVTYLLQDGDLNAKL